MAIRIRHADEGPKEASEINVTPFIDVSLVLLVIFMVAAPLATVNVPVDLPTTTTASVPRPDEPVFLTVKADQTLAIGEETVSSDGLIGALDKASKGNKGERVFLRADKVVSYGHLMSVLERLGKAGYLKVSLVTLQGTPDGAAP